MQRAMKTTKPKTMVYDVLAHQGDAAERWDVHLHGARSHGYFPTQKEAIAEARFQAQAHHPAKVVLHARDGHAYREFAYA